MFVVFFMSDGSWRSRLFLEAFICDSCSPRVLSNDWFSHYLNNWTPTYRESPFLYKTVCYDSWGQSLWHISFNHMWGIPRYSWVLMRQMADHFIAMPRLHSTFGGSLLSSCLTSCASFQSLSWSVFRSDNWSWKKSHWESILRFFTLNSKDKIMYDK